jgi:hypothetical protein
MFLKNTGTDLSYDLSNPKIPLLKVDPSNRIFQFFVQIFLLAHAVLNRRPKSHDNPMMRNGEVPG